jgi:hypothetical protein
MSSIRLKYVQQWVDKRNGGAEARFYFRRPGFKRVPLPGLPGSTEFREAYEAALAGQRLPNPTIGASRTKPGSIGALIVSYFCSPSFLALTPGTQQNYRLILEKFRSEHGDKPVTKLTRKHVNAMLAQKVLTPAAANRWLRLVKAMMAFAVEEDWRKDNPTTGIKPIKNKQTDSTLGTRLKSRNSKRVIQLAARRGSRSRCCYTRRNVAPMSSVWDGNTFAMTSSTFANKRRVRCWRSRCTLLSLPSSKRHRANT